MESKKKQSFNVQEIESEVLKFWKENAIFESTISEDRSKSTREEFVFYDGPPFANGMPHYGHILTGVAKDCVARHKTMSGFLVRRRWGWDCHGLPSEMAASKVLGLKGCADIVNFGVKKFNDVCRAEVLKYANEWQYYVERQGRWVQFKDSYKTMDLKYMESVLWAFKKLHKKGLIYEDYKVVPYSWACETPVSNFETRIDNSYRTKVSKAATVRFKLEQAPASLASNGVDEVFLLAWTTTPWTLVGNLALALGRDVKYSAIISGSTAHIMSHNAVSSLISYLKVGDHYRIEDFSSEEVIGARYEPLFPYFSNKDFSFVIAYGDFVSSEDGVGIVHIAPGFGEEDFDFCKQLRIEIVCPVDGVGRYTEEINDFKGMQVFEAEPLIIKKLLDSGAIIRVQTHEHQYPFCWRTDTPLIYKAVSSWFLAASKLVEQMQSLNAEVNWVPFGIRDGLFGGWIANARDWAISRNRFFGVPVPVWKSDSNQYPRIDVYGCVAEIEKDFDVKLHGLHLEDVDHLTRPNPSDPTGKSKMRRVVGVLDCWFESGAMPFAEVHYPFNEGDSEDVPPLRVPADFITEYVAQTRGWFYTLFVLSTALFNLSPFKNCICHGVVLASDGKKLSKRLGNYADPIQVMDSLGADSLRFAMLSSGVFAGSDLKFTEKYTEVSDAQKIIVRPLWNAASFYNLYANEDKPSAKLRWEFDHAFDRYIALKSANVLREVRSSLDEYKFAKACLTLEGFFDLLTNWYIRCNRRRFWKGEYSKDRENAYDALFTTLMCAVCASASIIPFIADYVFMRIGGFNNHKSIHLMEYEDVLKDAPEKGSSDFELFSEMKLARRVIEAANKLRDKAGLRVRQPLKLLEIVGPKSSFHKDILIAVKNEVNVAEIFFKQSHSMVVPRLKINFALLAKRSPDIVQDVAKNKGKFTMNDLGPVVAGHQILDGEYTIFVSVVNESNSSVVRGYEDYAVVMDLNVDTELFNAGIVRDFVRSIQSTRKDKGMKPNEKIIVYFCGQIDRELLDVAIEEIGASKIYIVKQKTDDFLEASIGNEQVFIKIEVL